MKVCQHRGLVIAILIRDEHCPPHAHVGTSEWDARFKFSFWHNGVQLWDVVTTKKMPSTQLLEELRQVLMQGLNLKKARTHWWTSRNTVCLDNQQWDTAKQEVVSPKEKCPGALGIQSGSFDELRNRTVLKLAGKKLPLEIQL
jgi:hypothetical protein